MINLGIALAELTGAVAASVLLNIVRGAPVDPLRLFGGIVASVTLIGFLALLPLSGYLLLLELVSRRTARARLIATLLTPLVIVVALAVSQQGKEPTGDIAPIVALVVLSFVYGLVVRLPRRAVGTDKVVMQP